MMPIRLRSVLSAGLIPLMLNQACSAGDPGYVELRSGELRQELGQDFESPAFEGGLQVEVTTIEGLDRDIDLAGEWLSNLLEQRPGVAPFLAGGKLTSDPLRLFQAETSRLKTSDGEVVQVFRSGQSLQAPSLARSVSWDSSFSSLAFRVGGESGTIYLPSQLSPEQARFLAAGLAFHWLNGTDADVEPSAEPAWGHVIVILLILIGAWFLAAQMGKSCCEDYAETCDTICENPSPECTPIQGGGYSFGGGVEAPALCMQLGCGCNEGSPTPAPPDDEPIEG